MFQTLKTLSPKTLDRPQLPELEVWFQRATDVVRKLMYGDVDLGIVGKP